MKELAVLDNLKGKGLPITRIFSNATFIEKSTLETMCDPDEFFADIGSTITRKRYGCFTLLLMGESETYVFVEEQPPLTTNNFLTHVTQETVIRDFLTGLNEQVVPIVMMLLGWIFTSPSGNEDNTINSHVADAVFDLCQQESIAADRSKIYSDIIGIRESDNGHYVIPEYMRVILRKFQLTIQRNTDINGFLINERCSFYKTIKDRFVIAYKGATKHLLIMEKKPTVTATVSHKDLPMDTQPVSRAKKIHDIFTRKIEGKHRDSGILSEILSEYSKNPGFEKELEKEGVFIECRHDEFGEVREVLAYMTTGNPMYARAVFEFKGDISKLYE